MWLYDITQIPRFPGSQILISGSFANGTYSEHSDIDIICLSKYSSYIYSESFASANKSVHITFFPKYKLLEYLICDALTKDRIYLNMWGQCLATTPENHKSISAIHKYIVSMKIIVPILNDDYAFFIIQRIRSLCDALLHEECNPELLASDLFLTAMRGLSGLQKSDTKHICRQLSSNLYARKLQQFFITAVTKHEYKDFALKIQKHINSTYAGIGKSTTGLTYNITPFNQILVFIPDSGMNPDKEKYLSQLEMRCTDNYYTFRIEPNQAMDAGLYLWIITKHPNAKEQHDTISKYCSQNARLLFENNVQILFPYRTAFETGLYFGGKEIHKNLTPLFCEFYSELQKESTNDDLTILCIIYDALRKNMRTWRKFLSSFKESLEPDVVDPYGIYNIEQTKCMSYLIKEIYNKDTMKVSDLCRNHQRSDLSKCAERIMAYTNSIPHSSIFFPPISYFGNKRQMLFRNVILHLQDIARIGYRERYASIHYYLVSQN